MKVYARHQKLQAFLKEQDLNNIEIVDSYEDCQYYISGRFSEEEYHDQLKGIIIPYTGHNNIDLDAMRKHKLQLFVTPTRTPYVAEKAVALLLALCGKVIYYHKELQVGNWSERNSEHRLPWTSIQDKTIGLYGYGRIGMNIQQLLSGFSCQFLTIDRKKDHKYTNITLVKDLKELVEKSDIIIISVPINKTTEHSLSKDLLSTMQDKFLINVGRGKVVDEEALYYALTNNTLKGYASDVWYNYPKEKEAMYPSNFPIHKLDNVVMSNHSGGFTDQTNDQVNQDIIKRLQKIRDNQVEDQLDLSTLQ